jgi:ubiquinone/menaquinone biosynthesis C-methylase UbiE
MTVAVTSEPRTSRIVRPLFRAWSRVYDLSVFQAYYGRIHDRILGIAPPQLEAVLDVGCGTGELLGKLVRRWPSARVVGLDLSSAMLAQAARKPFAATVELVEGSVYELPFDSGAFDLVTNTLSSHFYQDLPVALRELFRVTSPGGLLVMASLGNGPGRYLPGPLGREARFGGTVHRAPWAQRRALTDAGFTVERLESIFPMGWLYVAHKPARGPDLPLDPLPSPDAAGVTRRRRAAT